MPSSLFTPCTNLPVYFERNDDFNIISVWGLPSNHVQWLLGDFLMLLAQCCWWGVVFSEKAFQHSGNPTQRGEFSIEVSRIFLDGLKINIAKTQLMVLIKKGNKRKADEVLYSQVQRSGTKQTRISLIPFCLDWLRSKLAPTHARAIDSVRQKLMPSQAI